MKTTLRCALLLAFFCATLSAYGGAAAPSGVDYRYYSLDYWRGLIGLPDDAYKCIVDANGQFQTEIGRMPKQQPMGIYPNRPEQHPVMIQADLVGGFELVGQAMQAPRVPIAVTRKRQGTVAVTEYLFTARPLDWSARAKGAELRGRDSKPDARQYLMMVEYVNRGARTAEVTPLIRVVGAAPAASLKESPTVFVVAPNTRGRVSRPIAAAQFSKTGQMMLTLGKIALAPGAREQWVLAIDRNGFPDEAGVGWEEAAGLRRKAAAYWASATGLPYNVIQVPDPGIQTLLDTSIRELYQLRYVIDGLPAFYFGPGTYNGYWILDGSFVTEAMDMLGRTDDAGGYADYLLRHQQADGRFETLDKHWKETGIGLITLVRHAQLIQDKEWLARRWPAFERATASILKLRRTGDAADPKAPNYRLSPVGFGDGGVRFAAQFTNEYWLLGGLKAAIEAARWLGKDAEAAAWEKEYRDYQEVFQKAIRRDAKTDAAGNRYIPAVMGPEAPEVPTRGQWAFCQGVYPCCIFAPDDPLMLGTLKMLQANEKQGGIVDATGWKELWAQCGSFYGHDWLWLGQGQKAASLLYAFANHASPLRNWREEVPKQTKPGERQPYAKGSGDMPHVSAAAEFIRLTGHLLAFDRGDALHLFEGLPPAWLKPGMVTRLNGMETPFGPLTLELKVAVDGETAALRIEPLRDPACRKVVVHQPGTKRTQELAPDQRHQIILNLAPGAR